MTPLLNRLALFAFISLFISQPSRAATTTDTRPTVAVLYFDYSGKDEQLTVLKKGLAQMLISDLSGLDGVRIVERDRLEAVLTELALQKSGKIDPATAAKVGKLLGARYMVLGGYFDLMKTLRADARVVEVETGKVIDSVGASGKPDDFLVVEEGLSSGLAKILTTKTTAMPAATATSTATASKPPTTKAPRVWPGPAGSIRKRQSTIPRRWSRSTKEIGRRPSRPWRRS